MTIDDGSVDKKREACLRGIKGEVPKIEALEKNYKIYPGMIEIKNNYKQSIIPGRPAGMKAKGKIKGFSNKSRIHLLKYICKMKDIPQIRWEPTFTDDVMKDKTIEDKAKYSSRVLHNFRHWLKDKKLDINIIWKREWKPRGSGELLGEICPHFHMSIYSKSGTEFIKDHLDMIITKWVDLTGSSHPKRFDVAFHHKSFGVITDDSWLQYISKYASKEAEVEGESIGRSWGIIGAFSLDEGKEIMLTRKQSITVQRMFRRYMMRRQLKVPKEKRMCNFMKRQSWQGFIMMRKEILQKVLLFVKNNH